MSRDSPLLPILGNHQFPPGLQCSEFKTLRHSGIDHASRFMVALRWPSITELMNTLGPFQLPFWNALQLHHFLHSIPNPLSFTRQLTTFEE